MYLFVTCSVHHLFVCQLASFQKYTIEKIDIFITVVYFYAVVIL